MGDVFLLVLLLLLLLFSGLNNLLPRFLCLIFTEGDDQARNERSKRNRPYGGSLVLSPISQRNKPSLKK